MATTPDLFYLCYYDNIEEVVAAIQLGSLKYKQLAFYVAARTNNEILWNAVYDHMGDEEKKNFDMSPSLYGACMGRHSNLFVQLFRFAIQTGDFLDELTWQISITRICQRLLETNQLDLYLLVDRAISDLDIIDHEPLLDGAIVSGNKEMVEYLLEHYDYTQVDISNAVGLSFAKNVQFVGLIATYAKNNEIQINWGDVCGHIAINNGNIKWFELMSTKYNVDLREYFSAICQDCSVNTIGGVYEIIRKQTEEREKWKQSKDYTLLSLGHEVKVPPDHDFRDIDMNQMLADGLYHACHHDRVDAVNFITTLPNFILQGYMVNTIIVVCKSIACLRAVCANCPSVADAFNNPENPVIAELLRSTATYGRAKIVDFCLQKMDLNSEKTQQLISDTLTNCLSKCATRYLFTDDFFRLDACIENKLIDNCLDVDLNDYIGTIQVFLKARDARLLIVRNITQPSYLVLVGLLNRGVDPYLIRANLELDADTNTLLDSIIRQRESRRIEVITSLGIEPNRQYHPYNIIREYLNTYKQPEPFTKRKFPSPNGSE
jgi:hypothetical protein